MTGQDPKFECDALPPAREALTPRAARGPSSYRARRRGPPAREEGGGLMSNGNSVTLVGNITGRNPELRFTNTGQATTSFGLAVNRRWQNRQTQEWEEATSFFDIVCWREDGGEHGREPRTRLPGDRDRPARAAQLGDPQRGQAVQGRGGRRRDRPEHPLGHHAGRQNKRRGPGDGGGPFE